MTFFAHISEYQTRFPTIKEHLENTALLAGKFADVFGARETAEMAGLLHDIGKYSSAFQKRLYGMSPSAWEVWIEIRIGGKLR